MSASSGQGRCTVGGIALLMVLAGCHPNKPVRPTPPAPAGFNALDTTRASGQALRDYVAKLDFDANYEVGDEQRLALGRYPDLHYGPLAAIQPEIGNHTVTEDDLHQGRIIARIVNKSDEPYPKLGLAPHGITYWWARLGADSEKNQSVMISTDSTGLVVSRTERPLLYDGDKHDRVYRTRAVARWIWQEDDEQGWSSCGLKCCRN